MAGITYVTDEVPEELPDQSGYRFPGIIKECGFAAPPPRKIRNAVQYGRKAPDRMFVISIEPLNQTIDRNPESWLYEEQENYRRTWLNYLDKNGKIIQSTSPFGLVKATFAALGYNFRTNEDCQKLVGTKWMFESVQKKFAGEDSRASWLDLPVEQLPADYQWNGTKTVKREGYDSAPAVSDTQANEDAPKLVEVLNGKATTEWTLALATAGLGSYIEETANGGQALVNRMSRYGMKLEDGRLVKV